MRTWRKKEKKKRDKRMKNKLNRKIKIENLRN